MTPSFSAADPSTWPHVMSLAQVAELYQKTVCAVRQACDTQKFQPAPFIGRPYRWRRVEIERHVIGARQSTFAQKAG